jgi:hypothetical protein
MTEIDEEANSLLDSWKFVKDFLDQVKGRGDEGLSDKSREVIKSMNTDLEQFISNKKVNNPDTNKENMGSRQRKVEDDSMSDGSSDEQEETMTVRKDNKNVYKKTKKGFKLENNNECNTNSRKNKDTDDEITSLARVLERMDYRTVPELEKYSDNSGQDLIKYLDEFEDYCRQTFKGKTYLWIGELERHLTGRTAEAFKALRQFNDEYVVVKGKLVVWYKDETEVRKARSRQKFEQVTPKSGESIYIYSSRLENLYKTAYPRHDIQFSNTLLYKFKSTISKSVRDIINSQIMSAKLDDKKMTWATAQKCARVYDAEISMQKEESKDDEDKEIVINLSNEHTRKQSQPYNQNINVDKRHHNNNDQDNKYPVNYYQNSNNQNTIRPYQFPPRYINPAEQQRSQYQQRPRFNTPPPHSMSHRCQVCNRFGHSIEDCRTRLRSCFVCGDRNHFVRDCPNRNYNYYNPTQQQANEQKSGDQRYARAQSMSPRRQEGNKDRGRTSSQQRMRNGPAVQQVHSNLN